MVWQAYRRTASSGACSFCLMLASRGAVYMTEATAVAGHDHCNCGAELETNPDDRTAIRIDPADANKIIRSWTARGKTASYDLSKFRKLGVKDPPKAKVPKTVKAKPKKQPNITDIEVDGDDVFAKLDGKDVWLTREVDEFGERTGRWRRGGSLGDNNPLPQDVVDWLDDRFGSSKTLVDKRAKAIAKKKGRELPRQRIPERLVNIEPGAEGGRTPDFMESLDSLPQPLVDRVRRAGVEVRIVRSEGITGDPSHAHLKGVTPRGWEGSGSTWDSVPGGYDVRRKVVVLAQGSNEGSVNMALHEFGHAVDARKEGGVRRLSSDRRFMEAYEAAKPHLSPYLRQPGAAGPEEAFAELFATEFSPDHLLIKGRKESQTKAVLALRAIIRELALEGLS